MADITEREIAEEAYRLWEAEGRPESDGVNHWHQAQSNLQDRRRPTVKLGGKSVGCKGVGRPGHAPEPYMTRDEKTLLEGGDILPDSHVQAPAPVYGEPRGPMPNRLFEHDEPTRRAPDRNRDGFVSGPDVESRGDQVGNGPTGR